MESSSLVEVEVDYRYKLHLAGYSGDANDAFLIPDTLHNINGMNFSTYDNGHDLNPSRDCSVAGIQHGVGWWYRDCAGGEPNGAGAFFRWLHAGGVGFTLQTSRMMVKMIDV